MGIYPHPDYLGLVINVGGTPSPGEFYATFSGRMLSHIAKLAYGSGKLSNVLRINNTEWNKVNCNYRKSSTNCSSTKVPGALASQQGSWDTGAWLSLCPIDKNPAAAIVGSQYQVMWIPPLDDAQPGDLAQAPPPAPVFFKLPVKDGGGHAVFTPPVDGGDHRAPIDAGGHMAIGKGSGGRDGAGGDPVTTQKAGFPWWLGVGFGILALGGLVVLGKKKKKR